MNTVDCFFLILRYLLVFWCLISYAAGIWIFHHEVRRNPPELIAFSILLLIISPLSAWHGAIHYYGLYRKGLLNR